VKTRFRSLRLERIIGNLKYKPEDLIRDACSRVEKEKICNNIKAAMKRWE
jgi:hypothetical protein